MSGLLRELVERWRWPRRRARLPGPERVRELARDPSIVVRSARPARLARLARHEPSERLVGLLMVRDEDDVLTDMLTASVRWFDRILVLDGTTDPARRRRTREVLTSYPEVVFIAHDADVMGGAPVRDGARQFLLDEARRRYGTEQWIGVLHADEFIDQDPRPLLASRRPLLDPAIRVRVAHAFLHTDDEPDWARLASRPVRARVRHLMWPGVPESRFFFDAGSRDYRVDTHSKTVPFSLRPGPLIDGFCIVQYNERSPQQVSARAHQRIGTGWQNRHYERLTEHPARVFVDSLDEPTAHFAPEFETDPEGPFQVVTDDEVPIGPRLDWPRPLLRVGLPAVAGDGTCSGMGDRRSVDLGYLTRPGGLADLVESRDRLAVTKWALWMRDPSPGGGAHLALGGRPEPPGYRALLRYTTMVLASSRVGHRHRRQVGAEFVERLHGTERGWFAVVDECAADRVVALVDATVDRS